MAKVIKAGYARFSEHEDIKKRSERSDRPDNEDKREHDAGQEAEFRAAYEELINAAQDEVGLMLQDARGEALTLVRAAENQAGEVHKAAYEEGYREGLESAARETEEIISGGQRQIDELTARLDADHKRLVDELEPQVYRIALEVAEKILGLELDRNDEAFMSILSNAMESVKSERSVTLRVNSSEYARFFNSRDVTLNTSRGEIEARVNIDPVVQPGGLIIETESGAIDAGADAQLAQIRGELGYN